MYIFWAICCLFVQTLVRADLPVYPGDNRHGNEHLSEGRHSSVDDIGFDRHNHASRGNSGYIYGCRNCVGTSGLGYKDNISGNEYGHHYESENKVINVRYVSDHRSVYDQDPIVHKHVYVHIPPPEHEYKTPQQVILPPPPKKHYKIVFIKAPVPPTQSAPVIPAVQQNQEKTLIYVLHKQPERSPPIVVPTPDVTTPSKPEVYFIRYKTQTEKNTIGSELEPLGPSSSPAPHLFSSTYSSVSSLSNHVTNPVHSTIPQYSTTTPYRQ